MVFHSRPIPLKHFWLLAALAGLMTAPWACSDKSAPAAPAPVTVAIPATYPPCLAGGNTCTPTNTPCGWPSNTCTFTATSTSTPTDTPVTLIGTVTFTFTPSPTPTPTHTLSPTVTFTPTNSFTPTITWTPTNTFTATSTPTITDTSTPCGLPGNTCTPTATTCTNYGLTDHVGGLTTNFDYYYANQVNLASPTTVYVLGVWGYDYDATAEIVDLALYDNASGNLLASGAVSFSTADGSGAYKEVALSSPVSLAAGTYILVACATVSAKQFLIGGSYYYTLYDYGTYSGGLPPANYSSFFSSLGGFNYLKGNTVYMRGCP